MRPTEPGTRPRSLVTLSFPLSDRVRRRVETDVFSGKHRRAAVVHSPPRTWSHSVNQKEGIGNTIVMFGSARIQSHGTAQDLCTLGGHQAGIEQHSCVQSVSDRQSNTSDSHEAEATAATAHQNKQE